MKPDVVQLLRSNDTRKVDLGIRSLLKSIESRAMSWIKQQGGTRQDAEDCIQESIAAFYSRLLRNEDTDVVDPASYVLGILRYTWFDKINKKKRLPIQELPDFQIEDRLFDDDGDEQIRLILATIDGMSESCRRILTLFYFEKKSTSEISEILGYKGSDTVKTKKYKCLSSLREMVTTKWKDSHG